MFLSYRHIKVPHQIFKNELDGTKGENAVITFEMRYDPCTGYAFFGMLQEKGDLWQYAPISHSTRGKRKKKGRKRKATEEEGEDSEGSRIVEYSVIDTADPEDEDRDNHEIPTELELDKIDFGKLEVVFEGMTFDADYLAQFVNNIRTKKVLLKLAPDVEAPDGSLVRQPIMVEHKIGRACEFTYILAPADTSGDE